MSGYSLLQDAYDKKHRAYALAEENVIFPHLHLRNSRVEGPVIAKVPKMRYDERYTKYIRKTGLLPFVQIVSRGMPKMNPCALTALVDRWRPEAHAIEELLEDDQLPRLWLGRNIAY